jgi:HD-GYP domain-containing protein (c-di-GMP phosphodiesterase class II)
LVTALEARVPGAAGHSDRVATQSRLVAVVDTYDALTSALPYRDARNSVTGPIHLTQGRVQDSSGP